MENMDDNTGANLGRLQSVINKLIAPDGCSWDREQTPLSLCDYVVEEAHELVDAIRHGNASEVCEELGDVLFLLVFIATLYAAKGGFTIKDAVEMNAAKMIRRHPHVFENTVFENRDDQLAAWERIKRDEKKDEEGRPASVYGSLPKNLPPLIKAYRIHSKAARAGFTWDTDQDVEQQVEAEWLELLEAFTGDDKNAQEHELGDLIFTLVELGRRKGLKASAALDFSTQRFLRRFQSMEAEAAAGGKDFTSLDMDVKNDLWEKAKSKEKK